MTMINKKHQPKCLIVGGGLGGLALAQCLRKQGIPYEVFERDAADGARAQGWAISLHDWLMKDLLAVTCDDMPDLKTVGNTYGAGIPSEGAILDAKDLSDRFRFGASVGRPFIRASRSKLRHWLLTDLEVQWGKRFTHYIEDADGVTAYFEDGSSACGDILIGADGINSHVRHQLLDGRVAPQHVPMGHVIGEMTATAEQFHRWTKIATSLFVGVNQDVRLFVGLREANADGTAAYYWLFSWHDQDATRDDYWTTTASQAEMLSFVFNHLEGVHPALTEILHATPVEGILRPPLSMRDMVPPPLPLGRVTLLGDSTHPMLPFRGEGGNQAILDSVRLAGLLAAGEAGRPLEDLLKEYEAEMRERTTKSVLASREGL